MKFVKKDLERAVSQKIISEEQSKHLWEFLERTHPPSSSVPFNYSLLLQYLGVFVILIAMSFLATITSGILGDFNLFWIGLIYGILFFFVGKKLWKNPLQRNGGGLFLTLSVCMVPLMIFGFFNGWKWWEQNIRLEITLGIMEISTIVTALGMLYFFRFPLLTAPLYLAVWLLTIDIIQIFFPDPFTSGQLLQKVSIVIGLLMIMISISVDKKKTKEDYAFWGYFFGLLSFLGGLTMLFIENSDWFKAGYFLINIFLLLIGTYLNRIVFLIFGGIGILIYLSYLSFDFFMGSSTFPIFLSLVGVAMLYGGIIFQRYYEVLRKKLLHMLGKEI